jgi:hypothetical protein
MVAGSPSLSAAEREVTRFFFGAVCGVLLTVLAVFFADALISANAPAASQAENIVNWDVAGKRLASSLDVTREDVRDLSH